MIKKLLTQLGNDQVQSKLDAYYSVEKLARELTRTAPDDQSIVVLLNVALKLQNDVVRLGKGQTIVNVNPVIQTGDIVYCSNKKRFITKSHL